MPSTYSLADLPLEVLQHVFACLSSLHDRLQLSETCMVLHQLFRESPTLQYERQLVISDQLNVPNGPRPVIKGEEEVDSLHNAKGKLQMLQAREEAWRNLDYRDKKELVLDGAAGVYELQDSIFLMCEGYEPPMSHNGRPTVIRLLPLPGVDDEQLGRIPPPIAKRKLDFQIADLTMDPTQDLIVVSEHNPPVPQAIPNGPIVSNRYHLLSLSTFEPHPMAAMTVLDFPPSARRPVQTRQLLQVMGETLVILVSRFTANWMMAMAGELQIGNMMLGPEIQEELVCWNWKTGKVLGRKALLSTNFFTSLAVLSPTSFLITCTETQPPTLDADMDAREYPPVIELYSIQQPTGSASNEPLPLETLDTYTPRPRLVQRLGLPRFAPEVTLNAFEVRPDPPFAPLRADQPAVFGARKAFTQDPSRGVLVFDVSAQEPDLNVPFGNFGIPLPLHHGGYTVAYELFVLREFMIARLEESMDDERLPNGQMVPTTPWEEWGEFNSRMTPTSMHRRTWVCSCSGYRFVSLTPDTTQAPTANPDADSDSDSAPQAMAPMRRVRVQDFSPYNLRRHFVENRGKKPDRERSSDLATDPRRRPGASSGPSHDLVLDELMAVVEGDDGEMEDDGEMGDDPADDIDAESLVEWANGLGDEERAWIGQAEEEDSDGMESGSEGWETAASELVAAEGESMSEDEPDSEPEQPPNASGLLIATLPTAPTFGRAQAMVEPTTLRKLKVWEKPVVTRLPYRLLELEDEFKANGVMIDEERIMVVHTKKRLTPDGEIKTTQTMTTLMM